jgi:hypothetical protein
VIAQQVGGQRLQRRVVVTAVEPDALAAAGRVRAVVAHQVGPVDAAVQPLAAAEQVRRPDDRHPVGDGQRRVAQRGHQQRVVLRGHQRHRRRGADPAALAPLDHRVEHADRALVVDDRDRHAENVATAHAGRGQRPI